MKIHALLLICFTVWQVAAAQQLHYSAKDAEAMHDSIVHSRWDIGGQPSHYTFRYMSEFFPVAIIDKPVAAYNFPVKLNKTIDSIRLYLKSGSLVMNDYLQRINHINGIIVVHKGSIVYEKYFKMLPEDRHTLQSVTKVVTSTLITYLINSKKIDATSSIENYIPELAGTDWRGITVRQILDMRSGMDSASVDYESGPFTNPQHKNYQFESALGALPTVSTTPNNVYDFLKGIKKDKAAGVASEYSNLNTFVLGWLAEKVTGKKYADLVTEIIWKPMGASSAAYVCISGKGQAWSHGGISATLRDLARFGMLFTHSEVKARNESIISFAQLKDIFNTPPIIHPFMPFQWGYQWDLAANGVMMKGGFGGQALLVYPEKEIVIAYFNYIDKDWSTNTMLSEIAINEIVKAVERRGS